MKRKSMQMHGGSACSAVEMTLWKTFLMITCDGRYNGLL